MSSAESTTTNCTIPVDSASLWENTVGSGDSSAEAALTKIQCEVDGYTLSTDCMY